MLDDCISGKDKTVVLIDMHWTPGDKTLRDLCVMKIL